MKSRQEKSSYKNLWLYKKWTVWKSIQGGYLRNDYAVSYG